MHVMLQNEAVYVAITGQVGGTLGSLVLGWGDIKGMGAGIRVPNFLEL